MTETEISTDYFDEHQTSSIYEYDRERFLGKYEKKLQTLNFTDFLRINKIVPIRLVGEGAFGSVYHAFSLDNGIVAVKIFEKEKYDSREINVAIQLSKIISILGYGICEHTIDFIAKQPKILLPSYALRALMKQILEGMRAFHAADLVHRDIKCDNILLHSPPGSGLVHAKISDFGFAKKVDLINEQTYLAGTIPFMSPELFDMHIIITQKVDIYALGIAFYKLIIHKYPVNEKSFKEQQKKITQLKCIERPSEIIDDILWDLLSMLLEFDTNKRITAAEALQHPYFTSPEALADISQEQYDIAQQAIKAQLEGDQNITQFDKDPTFIVAESIIKQFILSYIQSLLPKLQSDIEQSEKKQEESQIEDQQTIENRQIGSKQRGNILSGG
ncbi:MAG: putative protein kinase domain protein, partial [Streblomastix strix]